MKNKKATSRQIKNAYCEHHSNLALLTAAVAMVAFMVLLVIYMGEFQNMNYYSYQKLEMSRGVSVGVGVASWIAAAVLSFVSVRKKKKYLVEYKDRNSSNFSSDIMQILYPVKLFFKSSEG